MLIDSHCHLEFPELAKDQENIIDRAKRAGVLRLVTISTTMRDFAKVHAVAAAHEEVYCSVGVHPHEAGHEDDKITCADLIKYADDPKIVGFGETGLDYFYDHAPRDEQQRNFREHIRASIATGLPLIIHTRDAEDDTIRILNEERAGQEDKLKAVLHCFSSKRLLAEEGLKMGFYISLSGMITFKKSQELRDIARDVPLDRLLVETDSPFLAPEPFRGKVCEPAYVVHTARKLAEIKGVSEEEVARVTTDNFFHLFSKVSRP